MRRIRCDVSIIAACRDRRGDELPFGKFGGSATIVKRRESDQARPFCLSFDWPKAVVVHVRSGCQIHYQRNDHDDCRQQ